MFLSYTGFATARPFLFFDRCAGKSVRESLCLIAAAVRCGTQPAMLLVDWILRVCRGLDNALDMYYNVITYKIYN